MAYRYGNREQTPLFPQSIEEVISPEDPVRVYDAFVNALDFKELGIHLDEYKVGNSEYDPRGMLKLLIYGYSYGFRSSRKLERAVHHNISFIWLVGGLKPDFKTISNFRRRNKKALKKVLKLCARMCVKLNLIEGNTLFIDGTKIRANAGKRQIWTENRCERVLKGIEKRIDELLAVCDAVDESEHDTSSLVKLNEELKNASKLKEKMTNVLKDLQKSGKESINAIDPDSPNMKDKGNTHPRYNAQLVTDGKHGLIGNSDVVADHNDSGQMSNQINQAQKNIEKECENAAADAGYSNTEELKKLDSQGINVIVPSKQQASHKEQSQFSKDKFHYDSENDCYVCPEGHILQRHGLNNAKKMINYDITDVAICKKCKHFGVCTSSKKGRKITRLFDEEHKSRFEQQYLKPESQAIYRQRKTKVELPFGYIKRNLKVDSFLLRGLEGVRAEFSLMSTCFNLSRMITLMGVAGLIRAVAV
jgi:transposase